ncbi:MAG: energy transducer TonB [Bryobacteraceae bacterium]
MNRICHATVLLLIAFALNAASLDSKAVNELLSKGRTLSLTEAQELEKGLEKTPEDVGARIELLSYYTSVPKDLDLATIRKARVRHILWIVDHDPKSGFGLFLIKPMGVYRVNCRGDELADAEAFSQVTQLWINQVAIHPGDATIKSNAAAALQYCAPEEAEALFKEAHDPTGLGRLYANAALGVTGESYRNGDPQSSDPALRQTRFAQRALAILDKTIDPEIILSAARTLFWQGGILWADGKLDWDYTTRLNILRMRAIMFAPDGQSLDRLPRTLPRRGERPFEIAVPIMDKAVAACCSVSPVQGPGTIIKCTGPQPPYPAIAQAQHIEGTVELTGTIDRDGSLSDVQVVRGHPLLSPTAIKYVQRCIYRPQLLNGELVPFHKTFEINYTLSK